MSRPNHLISEKEIKIAARVLRAVNHKLRLEILSLLHLNRKMTVTDLYEALRMEQSVASQHLGILRIAGVVEAEKSGKNKYYSINHKRLEEINAYAKGLVADKQ